MHSSFYPNAVTTDQLRCIDMLLGPITPDHTALSHQSTQRIDRTLSPLFLNDPKNGIDEDHGEYDQAVDSGAYPSADATCEQQYQNQGMGQLCPNTQPNRSFGFLGELVGPVGLESVKSLLLGESSVRVHLARMARILTRVYSSLDQGQCSFALFLQIETQLRPWVEP
jgi:hypothetical protein